MNRILITGVSGMLGSNLAWYFRDRCEVRGLYCSHPVVIDGVETAPVDLLSREKIRHAIDDFAPDSVVHCASLTNVDFCEKHPQATARVNVEGTRAVADALTGSDTSLVYISTDAVYDGRAGHFSENAPIAPVNVYGRSKYEGELAAMTHARTLVLRTNIFGWNILDKTGIGEWVLQRLRSGKAFHGFRDAIFSSIYTMHLAEVLAEAIGRRLTGVYNCGSSDGCSKYDFACRIAQRIGADAKLVSPASLLDHGFVAPRGMDLSLDVSRLEQALDHPLPAIDACLEAFCADEAELPARLRRAYTVGRTEPSLPYGRQCLDEDDIQAAVSVLRSDWITCGPTIDRFEEALCAFCGAKYAVAVSSGTAALHLAAMAAGLQAGQEAIVAPMTFAASANCVLYCGAKPVFADIRADTGNLDPAAAAAAITDATTAIIPIHYTGHPCDLDAVAKLAATGHLTVIEDAAHALGAEYHGTRIGSCTASDMAILSFHPVKHITTGEGGAVLTNRPDLYEALMMLRNHGICRDHSLHEQPGDPWYYELHRLGYNYRLTDIQAAMGISQLAKLPGFLARRREIAEAYARGLADVAEVRTPSQAPGVTSAWHLYVIRLGGDVQAADARRRKLYDHLRLRNIGVQVHYLPVHLHPYYRKNLGTGWGQYPVAEDFYHRCLSLPIFPAMRDGDVQRVVNAIKDILARR